MSCVDVEQHAALHRTSRTAGAGRNRQLDADHQARGSASSRIIGSSFLRDFETRRGTARTSAGNCRAILPLRSCAPPHIRPPSPADFRRTCWRGCPASGSWQPPARAIIAPQATPPPSALASVIDVGLTPESVDRRTRCPSGPCRSAPRRRSAAAGARRPVAAALRGTRPAAIDAPFALDRLDQDGAGLVVDQSCDRVEIAERGVAEAGDQRLDSLVILRLPPWR